MGYLMIASKYLDKKQILRKKRKGNFKVGKPGRHHFKMIYMNNVKRVPLKSGGLRHDTIKTLHHFNDFLVKDIIHKANQINSI